jgi:mono/diheme cytochrome c family protein
VAFASQGLLVDAGEVEKAMRGLLTGVMIVALAGGGLKDLTVSSPHHDTVSGRIIYSTICIRCHGIDGKGEGQVLFTPPVADLTSPAIQSKLDARLFKSVHDGKANTAMGAWREVLSDDEIWDVLAYVRTLASQE